MNNHVLEFRNVWKTYHMGDDLVNALAGLDLALDESSFTAVMGPSGLVNQHSYTLLAYWTLPPWGCVV